LLRLLLLFSALLVSLQPLAAQVVSGQLLEAETGEPLAGGTIALYTSEGVRLQATSTDSVGEFAMAAARAGTFLVHAERVGYGRVASPLLRLETQDTLHIEVRLSARTVVLDPVVVIARHRRSPVLSEFHERASRRAVGTFITRAEIERRHPHTTTALLRTVPGIRLVPRRVGGGSDVLLRGNCAPAFYIDGIHVRMLGLTIDDLVQPRALEGIEIYRSAADAPVEYTGVRGGCGVLLLWTRRGERRR
jgi:hypothetical protein